MISKDDELLDYETCKLLKEAGFDEPCEHLYETAIRHNGEDLSFDDEMDLKSEGRGNEIEYIEGGQIGNMYNRNSFDVMEDCKCVSAPDIYEVMRWFRRKHNINIIVDYNGDISQWCWSVTDCSTGYPRPYDGLGGTFEDAAKNAIANCLENLV